MNTNVYRSTAALDPTNRPELFDATTGRGSSVPARGVAGVTIGLPLALVAAIAVSTKSGLGLALTLAAVLIALAKAAGFTSSAGRLCLAAFPLVPWLVIRDNTWLSICIVVTVMLVLVLAVVVAATNQRVSDVSLGAVFRRNPSSQPTPVTPGTDLMWAVIRGVIVAAPVVAMFWTILASADQVFASIIDPLLIPRDRVGLFVVFVPVFIAAARCSSNGRGHRPAGKALIAGRFGAVESSIVLGAVSALFGVFIILRLATLDRPVDPEAWRSEVRSGFFQLLFVAALTVLLVLAVRQASGRNGLTGRVRVLAWLTIVLAAGIDALALVRIAQYVNVTFLSPLRFWSFGFGVWLFVVLALSALRLTAAGAGLKWFTAAAVMSWMAFLMVMAALNPDQRIAQHNFDAFEPTVVVANGEPRWVAVRLLSWLSEDATIVIGENLDTLAPMPNTRYDRMLDHLCTRDVDDSWRDWNMSRSAARNAIEDRC